MPKKKFFFCVAVRNVNKHCKIKFVVVIDRKL